MERSNGSKFEQAFLNAWSLFQSRRKKGRAERLHASILFETSEALVFVRVLPSKGERIIN
jgi:hypothetical protein